MNPSQKFNQLSLAVSPGANTYGHDRLNPYFLAIEPVRRGSRPPVLTRLAGRIAELYDDLRRPRWRMIAKQTNRTRRTERVRRMYSPRREAMVRLLQAITLNLDLTTMLVMAPDGRTGQLQPVTLQYLAKRAGLGLKRADRAMADIEAAGLVFVKQRREIQGGQWRSLSAIRRVSPLLFAALGLGEELKKARRRRKAYLERKKAGREIPFDDNPTRRALTGLAAKKVTGALSEALGGSQRRRRPQEPYDPSEGRQANLDRVRGLIGSLSPERRKELGG